MNESTDFIDLTYEEAREQKEQLDLFFKHPAKEFFFNFLLVRRKGFENQLIGSRVATMEDLADYNQLQGRVSELHLIPSMLEQLHKDLTEIVHVNQQQMEDVG